MSVVTADRPTPEAQAALGEHYHLGFPVAYVQRGNATVHLIQQNSLKTICGRVVYSTPGNPSHLFTDGRLTCNQCAAKVERALWDAQNGKRAK